MPQNDGVVLGGVTYEVPPFTLADVQKIIPLLNAAEMTTLGGTAATASAIHFAINRGDGRGVALSAADFQTLPGVTVPEFMRARKRVGQAVGFYDPDPEPGEQVPAPGEDKGVEAPL
jgi:hypothetical protein